MLGITVTAAAFIGSVSVSAATPSQDLQSLGITDISKIDNIDISTIDTTDMQYINYTDSGMDTEYTAYLSYNNDTNIIDLYFASDDANTDINLWFMDENNQFIDVNYRHETTETDILPSLAHYQITLDETANGVIVLPGGNITANMNNYAPSYETLEIYPPSPSINDNIFTHLSAIITGFVALLVSIFSNDGVVSIFWDTSGESGQLTLISILMLFGFGFFLVKYGFRFIYNLLKLKDVFK